MSEPAYPPPWAKMVGPMATLPLRGRRIVLAAVALLATVAVALSLAPGVLADSAQNALPPEFGQAWYWDRPDDPTGQTGRFWQDHHLYVAFDPLDQQEPKDKRAMVTALLFPLDEYGIPAQSTITKFTLTLLEHDSSHQKPPTYRGGGGEAKAHGLVACPYGEFAAGQPNLRLTDEVGGQCSSGMAVGKRASKASDPYDPKNPAPAFFAWKFDLTAIMQSLVSQNLNPAVSIEPHPSPKTPASSGWMVSFHGTTYAEQDPDNPDDPFVQIDKPGVFATIEWVPPAEEFGTGADDISSLNEAFVEETFTSDEGSVDDGSVPSDTGGEAAPEGADAPEPVQTGRVLVQGQSAKFWDIPFFAWLLAFVAAGFLAFAGWASTTEVPVTSRKPGAVAALMQNREV